MQQSYGNEWEIASQLLTYSTFRKMQGGSSHTSDVELGFRRSMLIDTVLVDSIAPQLPRGLYYVGRPSINWADRQHGFPPKQLE